MSVKLNDSYEKMIRKSLSGEERYYYNTYVFYCADVKQWDRVIKGYKSIIADNPMLRFTYDLDRDGILIGKNAVNIWEAMQARRIADQNEEERNAMIFGAITSSRRMAYNPRINYLMNLNVFMSGLNEFYFVLSICEFLFDDLTMKAFCKELGIDSDLQNIVSDSENIARDSYADMIKNSAAGIQNKCYRLENMQIESYKVDSDIAEIMLNQKDMDQRFMSLNEAVWSLILGRVHSRKEIAAGELKDYNFFSPLTIGVHSGEDIIKNLSEIAEEGFKDNGKIIKGCVRELEAALGGYIYSKADVIHDFSMLKNDRCISISSLKLKERCVFFPSIAAAKAPVNITYRRKNGSLHLEYEYDWEIYNTVDFNQCHNIYMQIIRSVIDRKHTELDTSEIAKAVVMDKAQAKSKEAKMRQITLNVLKSSQLFRSMSDEELGILFDGVMLRISEVGNNIVLPGCTAEYIGLIVSGKVAVERLDGENCIKPLYILKQGDVFGLEAFTDGGTIGDIYSAALDSAAVLYVPANVIKSIAKNNYQVWQAVIEIYAKRLEKFKKLWIKG